MMDFQQAEDRFKQLKAQFAAGRLSEPEFKTQLEGLMIQDEQGSWWMIGYETERWYRHDGKDWVQTDPPGNFSQKPTPVITPEPETTGGISTENAVREKADREKRLREEQERSKRIAQESPEQKPIQEVRQSVAQKSGEQHLTKENERKESIFAENIHEGSIWKFGKQEVIRGIIGAILYFVISSIDRSISSTIGFGFDFPTPIIVFFGIAYGPWVGLITGLFGYLLSFIFLGY